MTISDGILKKKKNRKISKWNRTFTNNVLDYIYVSINSLNDYITLYSPIPYIICNKLVVVFTNVFFAL